MTDAHMDGPINIKNNLKNRYGVNISKLFEISVFFFNPSLHINSLRESDTVKILIRES